MSLMCLELNICSSNCSAHHSVLSSLWLQIVEVQVLLWKGTDNMYLGGGCRYVLFFQPYLGK